MFLLLLFIILLQRTFSMDEKIAWGMIKVKDECLEGQTVDEWFPLTGKQGDGKEGMVQVVMQYKVRTDLIKVISIFMALNLV